MLNPSGIQLAVTAVIGIGLLYMLWRGLLNVATAASRGANRRPGIAAMFLFFTAAVLVAPGFISWPVPPPIWTWPIWFGSACGFFLMALKFCWLDGLFPGLDVRLRKQRKAD